MALLSVNVNKIATLRNARGNDLPNLLSESIDIIKFGAQGITVHPRPDGRHIRWPDVYDLKQNIDVELNIEGYPSNSFIGKVIEVKPAQCTLVPDPPEVLTSNAGWRLKGNEDLLSRVVKDLISADIRVSLFVDPAKVTHEELQQMKVMGVHRVELYTEAYASDYGTSKQKETLKKYQLCSQTADSLGLAVNAGHDLNLKNLKLFASSLPELKEVSIGHALVCDALHLGWEQTIRKYLDCLELAPFGVDR